MFPESERFLTCCVRDFRDAVTTPALPQQIKAFVRQEGWHGMVHRQFNERLKGRWAPWARRTRPTRAPARAVDLARHGRSGAQGRGLRRAAADGQGRLPAPHQRLRLLGPGRWWVYGARGIFTGNLRAYLRYFKPAFHPWEQAPAPGYRLWLETFNRTGDPLAAARSVHAAGRPAR